MLVAALHVAAVLLLIRAFAPTFTAEVTETVTAVFTVEISPPDPPDPPEREPEAAGAQAEAGRKAVPRAAAVAPPKVILASPKPAPPIAAKGNEATAGARDNGVGTGAGGQGAGTGAGAGGSGQGGGQTRKLEKIAGDINSARDYPRKTRALREGDHVIIQVTVDTEGRAGDCRVIRASRDAEADRITCRLAAERFRFRPRTDAAGNPVAAQYQWIQRWWAPAEKE